MKTPTRSSKNLPLSVSNFEQTDEIHTESDGQAALARAKKCWIRARKGIKRDGLQIVFESCEDRWNGNEWFREEMLKEKYTLRTMGHSDDKLLLRG